MAYATVASLSQQTKSSGTSHTMNYPATVAADELLLIVVEMGANNAPTCACCETGRGTLCSVRQAARSGWGG